MLARLVCQHRYLKSFARTIFFDSSKYKSSRLPNKFILHSPYNSTLMGLTFNQSLSSINSNLISNLAHSNPIVLEDEHTSNFKLIFTKLCRGLMINLTNISTSNCLMIQLVEANLKYLHKVGRIFIIIYDEPILLLFFCVIHYTIQY